MKPYGSLGSSLSRGLAPVRIYLDEDVDPGVKAYLEGKGHIAHRAYELGMSGMADGPAYVEAVRRGCDLIITCNVHGPEAFDRETRRYLRCQGETLPVPIHQLWEPGIGNSWPRLRFRFRRHSRKIARLARRLEFTDPEERRREAVARLETLLHRAGRGSPLNPARPNGSNLSPMQVSPI